MAGTLAACGSDSGKDTAKAAGNDATTTTTEPMVEFNYTGVASGVSGLLPFVIAKHNIGEKYGVKWNVTNLETGGVILRALTSGRADLSTMGAPALLQANDQFPSIRVLAPFYWMHGQLLSQSQSQTSTLAGLVDSKAKIVAPDRSSGIRSALELLTAREHLDFGKLSVVESNPTVGLAAVKKGEAAATVAWVPISTVQVASGDYREVVDIRKAWREETGEDMLNGILVTSQEWIDKHPGAPAKIRKSLAAGIDFLRTNDDVWQDPEVWKILGVTDAKQVPAVRDAVLELYVTKWTQKNTDEQIGILKDMIEMGIYPKVPDADLERIWAPAGV